MKRLSHPRQARPDGGQHDARAAIEKKRRGGQPSVVVVYDFIHRRSFFPNITRPTGHSHESSPARQASYSTAYLRSGTMIRPRHHYISNLCPEKKEGRHMTPLGVYEAAPFGAIEDTFLLLYKSIPLSNAMIRRIGC